MRGITELFPKIFRFDGESFYGSPVGVYLIELPKQVVLIDIPAFRPAAVNFVAGFNRPIVAVATHGPTVIGDTARWQKELNAKVLMHGADLDNPWLSGTPDQLITQPELRIGRLRVIHTPGHTAGSVCILDPVTGVLLAGDSIEGTAEGKVRDFLRNRAHNQDVPQRLESIRQLAKESFKAVLPFHYLPILKDGQARVLEFLKAA